MIGTLQATIEDAAVEAGRNLIAHHEHVQRTEVSRHDIKTSADYLSARIIKERLAKHYPDIPFYGEEGGGEARMRGMQWVVDPLDGTANYVDGNPDWGVSIGLVLNATPVAGTIYLPMKRELFSASEGTGMAIRWTIHKEDGRSPLEGHILEVSGGADPHDTRICGDWMKDDTEVALGFLRALKNISILPRILVCCTDSMMRVARGEIGGYVHPGPQPFDVAAGRLIVERAGGKVTGLDDKPFPIFSGKTMVATNGRIHAALLEALNRIPAETLNS